MKNSNCIFMAFSAGKVSTEGAEIKRYWGVGSVSVLGVNPNKAELEKIYDTTIEKDPEYLSEMESNGQKVASVRIDFVVKTDPAKSNGIELTSKVALFLRHEARMNGDKTKVQVIDKYGRTAWVTIEQAKNHEIPMYSNGPANLDADYRPAYVGEEDLTKFLISYLNIPSVMRYNRDEQKWYMVEHPEDSEARLEHIEDYFKGDFSELKTIIELQPANKVKVLFGVRTTDDNRQFQAVYTNMFLKNNVKDYSRLAKDVEDRKSNGAYPTTEFVVEDLKEYNIESTNFSSDVDDLPAGEMPAFGATPWGN